MSIHERLSFKALPELHEELMVTPYADGTDDPRVVAIPRPKDLALALAGTTDEWFATFLAHLHLGWPNRALAVARAAEQMGLQHLASDPVAADIAGGDCDPGFGVSPEDSASLLQLRQAIDAVGWNTTEEEERGDYVARVHQLREEIAAADLVHARNLKLQKTNQAQRAELRRFNRERRAYNQGSEAQLNDTFKRRPTSEQLMELRSVFPQWASSDDSVLRGQIKRLCSALGLKPR